MKKFLKTLGIIAIVLVCIVGVYLFACGSLLSKISNMPDSAPAQFVTDFTLLEEDSYEISEGDISMRIPTHYVTTNLRDYYMISGEEKSTKHTFLLFYKPTRYIAGKLNMENEFKAYYLDVVNHFDEKKPGYPLNLFFDIPEDIFELYKKIATINKHNYNFWNLATALETSYYLDGRQAFIDDGINIHAIYERDNVRAVVLSSPDLEDYYVVILFPKYNPEDTYLFSVETPDLDEVIKMLNTFEYKTGAGF